jgi:hypothetical protein
MFNETNRKENEMKRVKKTEAVPAWAGDEPVVPVAEPEAPAAMTDPEFVMPQGVDMGRPTAYVWAFLSANPEAARKAKIEALTELGFNSNMIKTQTSRWYKVGGDKSLWLAMEKVKRDAYKRKIDEMVAEIRRKAEIAAKAEDETAEHVEASNGEE